MLGGPGSLAEVGHLLSLMKRGQGVIFLSSVPHPLLFEPFTLHLQSHTYRWYWWYLLVLLSDHHLHRKHDQSSHSHLPLETLLIALSTR